MMRSSEYFFACQCMAHHENDLTPTGYRACSILSSCRVDGILERCMLSDRCERALGLEFQFGLTISIS